MESKSIKFDNTPLELADSLKVPEYARPKAQPEDVGSIAFTYEDSLKGVFQLSRDYVARKRSAQPPEPPRGTATA